MLPSVSLRFVRSFYFCSPSFLLVCLCTYVHSSSRSFPYSCSLSLPWCLSVSFLPVLSLSVFHPFLNSFLSLLLLPLLFLTLSLFVTLSRFNLNPALAMYVLYIFLIFYLFLSTFFFFLSTFPSTRLRIFSLYPLSLSYIPSSSSFSSILPSLRLSVFPGP